MAENGKSKGGIIAVATALITAGGAITVALINKPEPAPEPTPTPVPSPGPSPAPGPDPTPEPGPNPVPEPGPQPTPVPTPTAIADLAGTWSELNGSTVIFQQTGGNFEMQYSISPAFGGGFVLGEGQINGKALKWTLQYPDGLVLNCNASLNLSENQMQGQCVNNFGVPSQVLLNR